MRPEEAIRQHASRHLGLAPIDAYLAAGGTRDSLRRLLERGEWVRSGRRALRARAAPGDDRQDALAAVLDAGPGAVLSHESAAALWDLPGFRLLPAHVTQRQPHASKRRLSVGLGHWAAYLLDEFITDVDGIPVVTPSFLALQLFGTVHPDRARRAVSRALMSRLVDERSLTRVLDVEAEHGRNGIVLLRTFLLEDLPRIKDLESGLEKRFDEILVRDGQDPMRRQVNVGAASWIGRVDMVDDDLPFIVQLDSTYFHGALVDQEDDERQRLALEEAGFTVRRFTDDDCFYEPATVVRIVRDVRAALRRCKAA